MLSSMISEKLFFSGNISRLSVMILLVGGGGVAIDIFLNQTMQNSMI